MRVSKIQIDPAELVQLEIDQELTIDDRTYVRMGDGGAYTFVTEDEALEIAEAWRHVEQVILERRHGVLAVL